MSSFTAADRTQLAEHGIGIEDARRQLELLRKPRQAFRLLRPCRPGDGIRVLSVAEQQRAREVYEVAAKRGRAMKLVPASGAASRMFATLIALRGEEPFPSPVEIEQRCDRNDPAALELRRFRRELDRLPFAGGLDDSADDRDLLDALLTSEGLDLSERPKALIPFHRYGDERRTPLIEHLVEAKGYLTDEHGRCRTHFTVSPEHLRAFEAAVAAARPQLEADEGALDASFSTQSPASDTLALDASGEPFRSRDGTLLFRPGGHGALLANLAACGGDLLFIKNIDNIVPEPRQDLVARWQKILGGVLVELEGRIADALDRLDASPGEEGLDPALALLEDLGDPSAPSCRELPVAAAADRVAERLDRPSRVCGVVPNTGEPGGGPFWIERPDGSVSAQIVEGAEVASADGEQQAVFRSSTHFNPVQLVCSLRDRRGRPFDLEQYIDPAAVFISERTYGGRWLRSLERPGLWNGAMAGWTTLFVEVPEATFAPVKTLFDLLRPAHQLE